MAVCPFGRIVRVRKVKSSAAFGTGNKPHVVSKYFL